MQLGNKSTNAFVPQLLIICHQVQLFYFSNWSFLVIIGLIGHNWSFLVGQKIGHFDSIFGENRAVSL